MGLAYTGSNSSFDFSGNATVDVPVLGSFSTTVSGLIDSGGIENISFALNESASLFGFTVSLNVGFSYGNIMPVPTIAVNPSGDVAPIDLYETSPHFPYLSASGSATLTLPSWAESATVSFGASLFIDKDPDASYISGTVSVGHLGSFTFWLYEDGTVNTNSSVVNFFIPDSDLNDNQDAASYTLSPLPPGWSDYVAGGINETLLLAALGPLSGATVFYDANGNDTLDPGEPATVTGANGSFARIVPSGATTGQLVAMRGVDLSTGLPNTLLITAPVDASQITPLTTLVNDLMRQYGDSEAQANEQVDLALGIPTSVKLAYQDVLSEGLGGSADSAKAFATEVKVTSLVSEIDSLLGGLPGAPSQQVLSEDVFTSLAGAINASQGTLNLSDPATVAGLIDTSAAAAGLSINASVPALDSQAASVIAAVNGSIDALPVSGSSSYLASVVQAQVVAEGTIAPQLMAAAAGTTSIASVVANNTGAALAAEINRATIGQLNPSTTPSIAIAPSESQDAVLGQTGSMQFPVYLTTNGPLTAPVTVDYTTVDGTAAPGSFTPVTGTLTWPAGDTAPQMITVPLVGGGGMPNQQFEVVLSNPSNANIEYSTSVGTIPQTVLATTTTVSSLSGGRATFGQPDILEASVALQNTNLAIGAGSVTFYDGSTDLGTASLTDGLAAIAVPGLCRALTTSRQSTKDIVRRRPTTARVPPRC